jgi:hypothetical protein
MKWVHLNSNNVVDDRTQIPPENVFFPGYAATFIEVDNDNVDHGWSLVGGVWTAPPEPAPTPINPVPQSITRFQALAALHNAGLLTQVQAAINASTDPLVPLAWNNAQSFDRNSPMLAALSVALSISATELDQLFIDGSKIIA